MLLTIVQTKREVTTQVRCDKKSTRIRKIEDNTRENY